MPSLFNDNLLYKKYRFALICFFLKVELESSIDETEDAIDPLGLKPHFLKSRGIFVLQ